MRFFFVGFFSFLVWTHFCSFQFAFLSFFFVKSRNKNRSKIKCLFTYKNIHTSQIHVQVAHRNTTHREKNGDEWIWKCGEWSEWAENVWWEKEEGTKKICPITNSHVRWKFHLSTKKKKEKKNCKERRKKIKWERRFCYTNHRNDIWNSSFLKISHQNVPWGFFFVMCLNIIIIPNCTCVGCVSSVVNMRKKTKTTHTMISDEY